MKSLKKSLVFLVVLTMVLSTIAPVFAATPADVVGTNYEEAVGKLVTLGVIAGYEDGTFKPDNDINRAEFAKIACYVVGVKDAAELSKGTTKFKDVPATNWASGYINIASEKGLLKGYPDGTFKPDAKVTYAEAVTILVRALGMGPVVEGKGAWPANYLSKAAAAGVTDDVVGLTSNGAAIRGAIAQLTWNTLTAEMWGEKEYTVDGIVYAPLGKALLKDVYGDYAYANNDKYEPKEFSDITVVGTQLAGSNLKNDEIEVDLDKQDDLADLLDETEDTATLEVTAKDIDLNSLFGKKVDLLLGKDNKVAYIKASNEDVITGTVDEFNTDETKLKVNKKEYSFKSDAKVYFNGVPFMTDGGLTFTQLKNYADNSTVFAQLVLDGGKIKAASLSAADALALPRISMTQGVVKEIKSNGEVRDLDDVKLFDMDDVTSDMDYAVFVKNGKPATEEDLKVGDVVTYLHGGDIYAVYMSDVKVTGKATKVASAKVGNEASYVRKDFTIDGKEYKMVNDGTVMMTKTGDDDDAVVVDSSVSDFSGKEVTLKLNSLGEIAYVSGNVKSSATMQVGVVTKDLTQNGDDFNIKILTPAGVATSYVVTGDKYYVLDSADDSLVDSEANEKKFDNLGEATDDNDLLAKGAIVAYDVSADGKIKGDNLFVLQGNDIDDGDLQIVHLTRADIDSIKDSSKKFVLDFGEGNVLNGSYYANSSTTYLNSAPSNIEKIEGWDSVVSGEDVDAESIFDDANDIFFVLDGEDSNTIKSLIVDFDTTGIDYESSEANFGVYVGADSDSDDNYVTLFMDGNEKRYVVYSNLEHNDYEEGDLVMFQLNGDGEFIAGSGADSAELRAEISDLQDLDDDSAAKDVYKVDKYDSSDRLITFKDDGYRTPDEEEGSVKSVKLASDVVVYNVDEDGNVTAASASDISKGKYVVVDNYDDEDDVYDTVVIFQ